MQNREITITGPAHIFIPKRFLVSLFPDGFNFCPGLLIQEPCFKNGRDCIWKGLGI